MDPGLAQANLAPPRPSVFARGLVPALVAHVLLAVALANVVSWKRTPDPDRVVSVPGVNAPAAEAAAAAGTRGTPSTTSSGSPRSASAEQVIEPGLASVRATPSPRRPATAAAPPAVRVQEAEAEGRTAMGAPAAPPGTRSVQPSFDCTKARSPAERAICADPELAQLDRDLGRLYARAKVAATDAAAFRRENDAQWRRRETTCRGDGACLREWYAQRREQLLAVLGNTTAGR